jgi:hypothetical protein
MDRAMTRRVSDRALAKSSIVAFAVQVHGQRRGEPLFFLRESGCRYDFAKALPLRIAEQASFDKAKTCADDEARVSKALKERPVHRSIHHHSFNPILGSGVSV